MMLRVPEPEAMDSEQEAADYDAMDHREVNGRFADDVLEARRKFGVLGPSVLDVGTGTALIPIALCDRDPHLEVVATDIAEAMLRLAKRNVAALGFEKRIHVQHANGANLRPMARRFDVVMSNTIVHHVVDVVGLFQNMVSALKPDGLLFVRDLVRPGTEAEVQALVTKHATIPPNLTGETLAQAQRQRDLFAASLRAGYTVDEMVQISAPLGIGPDCFRMTSDRHWTLCCKVPS